MDPLSSIWFRSLAGNRYGGMRSFWVKRGEWVIGPVTEQQIRLMASQQWFRSTDQIGGGESGPWADAQKVVPGEAFNLELTTQRESILEPARPMSSRRSFEERLQSGDKARPYVHTEQAKPSGASAADSEAPPAWFRRSEKQQNLRASEDRDRKMAEDSHIDFEIPPDASDEIAAHSLKAIDFPMEGPGSTENCSGDLPLVDDLFGVGPPLTNTEPSGRFETAEFDSTSRNAASADAAGIEDRPRSGSGRRTASGDWNFDLATGLASAGEDSEAVSHRRKKTTVALPDVLEVDDGEVPHRKPVTDWELVVGDLQIEDGAESEAESGAYVPVHFELSVHNLKTGKVLSAAESAASAELDFARLANLAAGDPAVSRSELPAAQVSKPPPSTISSEERSLRRSIGSESFQTQLSVLHLTIGLQSCVLSAVVNTLLYLALRRLFLLSTETFFPWGTGSLEVLEGADLALAGTAMAITFALPFLGLSYLIRVDGQVLFYLISLGGALIPAIAIGSGTVNSQAGAVCACLLLALPAVVSAVLCGLLAAKSADKTLQQLLAGSAGVGILLAVSIGFAAPDFNIEYLLRELPPELHVDGGLIYVVFLFYSVQLTLLYFVVARIAKFCLDEVTQQFVAQHMHFHWMLTMAAFTLVGAVHARLATGWGAAPILLGGLTAVVSLGFNLWSLVGHLEPRLDRLRVDD